MIKVLILVATYLFSMNAMSDGLLRTTNLKSYCGQYDRQTVIYLDQGIISKKDPNWFKDILNKLKFLPGEQVQVVTINHGGSVVEEAWSGCYPALTEERYQKEKAQEGFTSLVTGGVDDKLKNDQKMFSKWLKQGLAAPLARTQHSDVPRYTESSFPIKKLVEALYYDAPRLDLKNGISRVILFSDMVGQHFDILWTHIRGISNSKKLEHQRASTRGILDGQKNIVVVSNGEQMIDVFVANIREGGSAAQQLEGTYGLSRVGR